MGDPITPKKERERDTKHWGGRVEQLFIKTCDIDHESINIKFIISLMAFQETATKHSLAI